MKKLVIVESPSKVKTIKKYLGKDYDVKSSKGHIVDLPKSELGVDPESKFEPTYVVTKKKALQDLKKAFKGKDTLVLAVDPDREGEAIGWHVARQLGVITKTGKIKKGMKLERIVFTSITKDAVQDAVKNPRKIDTNLFNAQQARRVLDRLVGYKLSPLLWKKIRFGLSAGRVQSVALRLVVEKEEEREAFDSEEYWKIFSNLSEDKTKGEIKVDIVKTENDAKSGEENELVASDLKKDLNFITFELNKFKGKKIELTKEREVKKIQEITKSEKWIVTNIGTKASKRNTKPPFTTSTLQQTASNWFGYSPKRTMSIAQKLYEQGAITYMRTDSTNLSADALKDSRKLIKKEYGDEYLPADANLYKTKAKVAQEAHEAIRPSNFNVLPEKSGLEAEQYKLYQLIWQRAVASQMVPAKLENGRIEVDIKDYLFVANGQRILFDGYLRVYPEKVSENVLPEIEVGKELYLDQISGFQYYTKPPARFSEASLIKALESHGIGRPSTYVPTLSTIQARKYVEKEGKTFFPTDTGRVVTNLLRDHFKEIMDYDFTAQVEGFLDDIANGKENWIKVMGDFYFPFEKNLLIKDKEIDRENYTVLGDAPEGIKCPDCKAKMVIKLSRYGRFFSCSKWPDCKGLLDSEGKTEKETQQEAVSEEFLAMYQGAPKTDDGRDYLLKRGRYGKFWAHPDYPKVKDAKPLEYTDEIFKAVYGEAPTASDDTEMILRRGRFGEFWAHSKYPEIKEVVRINKKEIQEKKEAAGVT